MEKYQINEEKLQSPDKNVSQSFCSHDKLKFADVSQFITQCDECQHTVDLQLYILVMPSFISITLANLILDEIQKLYAIDCGKTLLCRLEICIPEHPVVIPILSYADYQSLFRWLGLIVGCFYDLTFITNSQEDIQFFNDHIIPACYDLNDG
jgi:hypothetical protein